MQTYTANKCLQNWNPEYPKYTTKNEQTQSQEINAVKYSGIQQYFPIILKIVVAYIKKNLNDLTKTQTVLNVLQKQTPFNWTGDIDNKLVHLIP